ncbi:MAG: hypothetical protein E7311_01980 [Clostridiales bacterium]|nr:hypothetical protein [Clostridiales bacterium]
MGRIIEGFWNCKYCGSQKIKGRFRECPNCGKPRDKDTRFEMPDKITYVPEEEAKNISRNPDWLCQYCNSLNPDSVTTCKSCGAERTSENLDYFENKAKLEVKESTLSSYSNDSFSNYEEDSSEKDDDDNYSDYYNNYSSSSNSSSSNFFKNNWKVLTGIPIILALIIGMIYLFIPKEQTVTIDNLRWERSIDIERYQTVKESDWSLPSNARLLYSNLEFSHFQQVLDHYETKSRQVAKERIVGYEEYVTGHRDLGNGYYEEITSQRPIYETYYETEYYEEPVYKDVPIYLTKYYYEIDKWLHERYVETNGKDKNPYWGETNLSKNERVSSKSEKYYIIYLDKDNKSKELTIDFESWKKLELNQTIKIKVSILGTCELIE